MNKYISFILLTALTLGYLWLLLNAFLISAYTQSDYVTWDLIWKVKGSTFLYAMAFYFIKAISKPRRDP